MQNIEDIYKEYFEVVYKYIFCLTNNKYIAEEITQDTFTIAVKEIKKFRGECKVSVWLCQIAKRQWYKELKKLKRNKIIPLESLEQTVNYEDDIEKLILQNDSKSHLLNKMKKLDETTKEVILLRISGNLSFKQIGSLLGKSENWARVTFHRGKNKIIGGK